MAFVFLILSYFSALRKCLLSAAAGTRDGGRGVSLRRDGNRHNAAALGWVDFRILTFCLAGDGKNLIYGSTRGIGLTSNVGI